jgi:hypothetical protein
MTLTDDEARAIDEAARVAIRDAEPGSVTRLSVNADGTWLLQRVNSMGAIGFSDMGKFPRGPGEALRRLVGR